MLDYLFSFFSNLGHSLPEVTSSVLTFCIFPNWLNSWPASWYHKNNSFELSRVGRSSRFVDRVDRVCTGGLAHANRFFTRINFQFPRFKGGYLLSLRTILAPNLSTSFPFKSQAPNILLAWRQSIRTQGWLAIPQQVLSSLGIRHIDFHPNS